MPLAWRLLIGLGASVLLFLAGFGAAWRIQDWRAGAAAAKQAQHTVQTVQKQAAASQAAAVRQASAQAHVAAVRDANLKEIPHVVTPEIDHGYPLPAGLVRVYDASLLGRNVSAFAEGPGQPDAAASPVTASAAAAGFAGNNAECLADRETLTGVQDWAVAQGLADKPPEPPPR